MVMSNVTDVAPGRGTKLLTVSHTIFPDVSGLSPLLPVSTPTTMILFRQYLQDPNKLHPPNIF